MRERQEDQIDKENIPGSRGQRGERCSAAGLKDEGRGRKEEECR